MEAGKNTVVLRRGLSWLRPSTTVLLWRTRVRFRQGEDDLLRAMRGVF